MCIFLSGLSFNNIYQQEGDAKNPYFVQYSAVSEDLSAIISWTNMKINILIKNILKPLNTHFNTFLIELFSAITIDCKDAKKYKNIRFIPVISK